MVDSSSSSELGIQQQPKLTPSSTDEEARVESIDESVGSECSSSVSEVIHQDQNEYNNRNHAVSIGPRFNERNSELTKRQTTSSIRKDKSRLSIFRDISFLQRESSIKRDQFNDLPILCEGYLTKRGHVITNWKTRYFVLRGDILLYYLDEDAFKCGGKPHGQVQIARVTPWSGENHGFMFFTDKKIAYHVHASSEVEQQKWMNALNSFIIPFEAVDYEGYLTKRGHLVPSWRMRYFILRGTNLKYYYDRESYHSNQNAMGEVEVASVARWEGKETGIMFKTSTGNMFYVFADTVDDQKKWLAILKKGISTPDPISCAGYLTKQGHKRKSWKKRYFALRGSTVLYYSDYDSANSSSKPLGQVTVDYVQPWDGEPFGFMFITADQVPFYVYAENDRERQKWLSTFKKSTGDSQENASKACPRCNAQLTGTRFCGACGYKITSISSSEQSPNQSDLGDSTITAVEEDGQDDRENAAFDELEALSEGARTLLLAVMQTPAGIDIGDAAKFKKIRSERISEGHEDSAASSSVVSSHSSSSDRENVDSKIDREDNGVPLYSLPKHQNVKDNLSPSNESFTILQNEEKSFGYQESKSLNELTSHRVFGEDKNEEEVQSDTGDVQSFASLQLDYHDEKRESASSFKENNTNANLRSSSEDQSNRKDLYHVMERELGFNQLYLPSTIAPVRCRFYGSMNYASAQRILLFVADSGPLGLWRQDQALLTPSVDHPWSMMKYLCRAFEEGYGVIVSNPFSNNVKVFEEGGRERIVPIPGSSSPKEHVDSVWENYIAKCNGPVSIITYARGAALVKVLLESHESSLRKKLHRVAFIESRHVIDGGESGSVIELLGRRTVNFEASKYALGAQVVESQSRVGCVCLSLGIEAPTGSPTPIVLDRAIDPVFAFLAANPDRPGMTAIVQHVRSALRMHMNQKTANAIKEKSSVVVLGETRLPPKKSNRDSSDVAASASKSSLTRKLHARPTKEVLEEKTSDVSSKSQPGPYYIPQKRGNAVVKPKSGVSSKDFELIKVVGQGGFGKVLLAKKITEPNGGRYFAMKILKKNHVLSSGLVNTTMAERHILTEISHPFIVKLHYAFQSDSKLYLVMDYLSGGSISVHLRSRRRFSEEWARFYAAEVAAAMAHLHSVNIIYRDAKLENVLMDHLGHVRITDFGLSKVGVSGLQGATTFCGTAAYIAPELLRGNPYGKAADWWSFGILLYEMIAGKPPYYHRNRDIMFQTILKQEWVTFSPAFSDSAVSLIRGLLIRDPMKRLGSGSRGADEILTHPFFDSINWARLLAKEIPPPFNPGVGEIDTAYVAKNLQGIIPRDRETSAAPPQDNDLFDGFSFIGKPSGSNNLSK